MPPRDQNDVEIAAGHLDYEFSEFLRNSTRIHNDNAFLEAYLLHARNLIKFLIGRGRRHPNDITPNDFASGWRAPETEATQRLSERLPDIDQQLSHLSWERVAWMKPDRITKAWNYVEIKDDMIEVFVAFVEFVENKSAPGLAMLASRLKVEGLR